jgi:hypothetical protein
VDIRAANENDAPEEPLYRSFGFHEAENRAMVWPAVSLEVTR